ncbi:10277_t:CDS:2 [Scutellospora calospora]|uniref:10277_t:CDS:1 n=1 Tax=Scutellospora calospora TaxID=85575 RepID=A0ACA9KC99_9GLOM|nr:10277_t:CDS:2 [Scutellospora calospora]
MCAECRAKNCVYCNKCNSKHWSKNFDKWRSGDSTIDEIIRETQLNADRNFKIIEWIEYSNLENIEYIARGGYGDVYRAVWKDGPIKIYEPWDTNKSEWRRNNNKVVAVKTLNKSKDENMINELYNEIKCNLEHNSLFVCRVYGVTRDPKTQEYAIISQFQEYGNIRNLIRKHYDILTWRKCINVLRTISNDRKHDFELAVEICDYRDNKSLRPTIPEYVPELYKKIMKECWKHNPEDRPTAKQLSEEFYDIYRILNGEYPKHNKELSKSNIEKEFNKSREKMWKERLAGLAKNQPLSKETLQLYTSKHHGFSKLLSQKLQQELHHKFLKDNNTRDSRQDKLNLDILELDDLK